MRRELKDLYAELEQLRADPMRVGPSHAQCKVQERIVELNHREEIMWKQCSRIMWLAEGDKNTRFFHLRASQRRRKNKITKLRKPDGEFTENEVKMGALASAFYKDLYTSEGTEDMERVLSTVPTKVTTAMNEQLLMAFEKEEIKRALFQMFPAKAPGPDGLPAHFFQRNWELCGDEISEIVLQVLRGEDDPTIINNTCIVLIPKVDNPNELGQFRPISLCNVIYKIASKVMANRLKLILPEIISEE